MKLFSANKAYRLSKKASKPTSTDMQKAKNFIDAYIYPRIKITVQQGFYGCLIDCEEFSELPDIVKSSIFKILRKRKYTIHTDANERFLHINWNQKFSR